MNLSVKEIIANPHRFGRITQYFTPDEILSKQIEIFKEQYEKNVQKRNSYLEEVKENKWYEEYFKYRTSSNPHIDEIRKSLIETGNFPLMKQMLNESAYEQMATISRKYLNFSNWNVA